MFFHFTASIFTFGEELCLLRVSEGARLKSQGGDATLHPLSLCFHSLSMSLTLSPPLPPPSHIPRMLHSSGDKVSTAEVTTRCNRYPSPQPAPPPPNDATPPSLLSGRVSVGC